MDHPSTDPSTPRPAASVDPEEVARFEALAAEWWDANGRFAPLHRFNPARLAFLKDALVGYFRRDPRAERPLEGLTVLDIGCGGGLVAEPMARLGAQITGIDAGAATIEAARRHAQAMGLAIAYRVATVEELVAEGAHFDAVLALEVIEHVAEPPTFVNAAASVLKPEGLLAVATLNRTAKSFLLAIVGAEYVLRWLPRGTHDWNRFIRPRELDVLLAAAGLEVGARTGVAYNPLADRWSLTRDTGVNYMVTATPRGRA